MTRKEELDIWNQVQNGDKIAFDKVYQMHIDALYNYGSSLTSDTQLVEDAIQEVFVAIWTKRTTISINSNLKGYLFTSLRRTIITQLKDQNKIELKAEFNPKLTYKNPEFNNVDQRIEQVRREIAKLAMREKEAIVLKYQEGLSYDEISNLMSLKNRWSMEVYLYHVYRYRTRRAGSHHASNG